MKDEEMSLFAGTLLKGKKKPWLSKLGIAEKGLVSLEKGNQNQITLLSLGLP